MRTKGPIKPIYTSNPKDPKLRAYNDSMTMHSVYKGNINYLKSEKSDTKASQTYASNYKKTADARKRLKNPNPEKTWTKDPKGKTYENHFTAEEYKKPEQPVIYKKSEKPLIKKTAKAVKAKPVVKSKPVVKAKPVEKVTMKPVTEEDSNALKAGFKKQTGKEFKSQDSDYNKLEKKLGRKPTVAEYNKSIKKP
jgi:hypothetical protein